MSIDYFSTTRLKSRTELIDCECAETTSAQSWASLTIGKFTPEALEESAAVVTQLHTELAPSPTGQITYVERVPYGVVLAIAPWNAPVRLLSRHRHSPEAV